MLIDWFTVVAQIINFLILVWFLKRFLYGPILDAIDAREKHIKAELTDAEAKKIAAQRERDKFEQKNQDFDKARSEQLNEIAEEAKAKRKDLFDAARQEADGFRIKMQQNWQSQHDSLREHLAQEVRHEVFSIAQKILNDLANSSLEARILDVLIHRLQSINENEQAEIKHAFVSTSEPLEIRSAFSLSESQRESLETAIKQFCGKEKNVQFTTDPNLISGIEISADGQKIAWSISQYLKSLSEKVDSLLKAPLKNEPTMNLSSTMVKPGNGN